MVCDVLRFTDGSTMFICGTAREKRCQFCSNVAEFECDAPAPRRKSKTCDKRMCADHRTKIADAIIPGPVVEGVSHTLCAHLDTVDMCPDHAGVNQQLELTI